MANPPPTAPDRRRPAGIGHEWPIALVLAIAVAALAVVAAGYFRSGSIVLAGAVMLAFFLRALLPTEAVGMLASRNRGIDLLALGALGVTISVLAFAIPAGG